jgi:hypothetical protein
MPSTLPMAAPISRFRLIARSRHSKTMMAAPISNPTARQIAGQAERANQEADNTDDEYETAGVSVGRPRVRPLSGKGVAYTIPDPQRQSFRANDDVETPVPAYYSRSDRNYKNAPCPVMGAVEGPIAAPSR